MAAPAGGQISVLLAAVSLIIAANKAQSRQQRVPNYSAHLMVFNLLAAIAVTCADGGDFAHTISRPPGGMLGDCGLSMERSNMGALRTLLLLFVHRSSWLLSNSSQISANVMYSLYPSPRILRLPHYLRLLMKCPACIMPAACLSPPSLPPSLPPNHPYLRSRLTLSPSSSSLW